jgi:hypothetical protein
MNAVERLLRQKAAPPLTIDDLAERLRASGAGGFAERLTASSAVRTRQP